MPRQAQFIWPILALVASFLAVFGISSLLATDRQPPTAQPGVTTTVTAPPPERTASSSSPGDEQPAADDGVFLTLTIVRTDKLPSFLVENQNGLCLEQQFATGWVPMNLDAWQHQNDQWCLVKADRTDGQLVLKFRAR